jgi:hypothetical protein
MKRWLIGLLALSSFNLTARSARAEEPAQESLGSSSTVSNSKSTEAKVWYGAPIVLTDIAALGALAGGTALADRGFDAGWGLILLGTGAYLVGGPIVHFAERGARPGFASLGLRAGAAAGGALTGAIIGGAIGSKEKCGTDGTCGLTGAAVGFVFGLLGGGLVAMVVDSSAFAYKSATLGAPALAVTPVYHPATHQAGLALLGSW